MLEPSYSIRQPLRLRIGFSYCLLGLLSLMHGGAALCVWLAPLPMGLQIASSLLLAWSLHRSLRKHLFWQHRSIPTTLVMRHHQLYLDDERLASITRSYVQPFWLLLQLQLPNGRAETLLICVDSIAAEDFRRLRVLLKHPDTRR